MVSLNDMVLLKHERHVDYLDSFIKKEDYRYIRNLRFCRNLVELGYRSSTDLYTEEQFFERRKAASEVLFPTKQARPLFSHDLKLTDPVLKELAIRESANRQKVVSTIIFLKHRLKNGFEISGYIDLDQSVTNAHNKVPECTDWRAVFEGTKRLVPKANHLSFFDWHKSEVHFNNTINYQVINDHVNGLTFMYNGDRKKICVDSTKKASHKNCTRHMTFSPRYGQVTFYDHVIRKKM